MSDPVPSRADTVLPSRDDPLVGALSEVVGGPLGRRARARTAFGEAALWSPLAVLAVLSTLSALLGLLEKQACRSRGFATPDQFFHLCYSDAPALFGARGLADGLVPYFDGTGEQVVEYPVLQGFVMWVAGILTPGTGNTGDRAVTYFDVNLILTFVCTLVTVVATARLAGRRPYDGAIVALAPGLILTATINWDMWAVMLTALAMLMWARQRPVAFGFVLGLAVAMKFYPFLLLGPLLMLCLRTGRVPQWAAATATAAVTWLIVNLPVMLFAWDNWLRFYTLSRERGAGFSSVWFSMRNIGIGVPDEQLNFVAQGCLVLCCAAIAWLTLAAPRRPRWPQLAFLVVAAFLLCNKVYSPQYVLWLVPLAALARPRWRDVLIWQATQVVHFAAIWLYLASYTESARDRALPVHWYDGAVLLHILGTLWFVAAVVRDSWAPEHDPVRADGSDDPAGGLLDGAADVLVLRGRRLVRPGSADLASPVPAA